MQMINEISVMGKNKNLFNKIITGLKKNRDKVRSVNLKKSVAVNFQVMDTLFSYVFYVELKLEDIITVNDGSDVFFCARIAPAISSVKFYAEEVLGDVALFTIDSIIRNRNKWFMIGAQVDLINKEGIDGCSSNEDIKNTKLYKELSNKIKKMLDIKFKTVLDKNIKGNLKVRENIMPLIVYHDSKDSCGFLQTKTRTKFIAQSGDKVSKMCEIAIKNSPYRSWCNLQADYDTKEFDMMIVQ